MIRRLRAFFNRLAYRFLPDVRKAFQDQDGINTASRLLGEAAEREKRYRDDYYERLCDLAEATQMAGIGPWKVSPSVIAQSNKLITAGLEALRDPKPLAVRETVTPITSQGAFGDIELALQNVEWRREINLSWLEFSRWGIQQIILISRLFFVKNPMIQRGTNIASYYVFGRGVEVTSDDDDANDVLEDFFERNKKTLGIIALAALNQRLYYDGQVFFCFFVDAKDKGNTTIRTIDATEIQDIITDPDDTDQPQFYHRQWVSRTMDPTTGQVSTESQEAWYPALGYQPDEKLPKINEKPVMWDTPIYHMKSGIGVSKWHFDVPKVYAAIDWAKAATKFLEACLTVKKALAQISMTFTTKGGQQALEGAKQQLQTRVNAQPGNSLWDTNPTPVNASIFASGPGSTLAPFNTKSAGGDPEEVRQFKLMVCMVLDIPETFLADMNTSNLATAQTLDRPTELAFLAKQEAWRETLLVIAKYVLAVSKGAPSGQFAESLRANKINPARVRIVEMQRRVTKNGRYVYEAVAKQSGVVRLKVNFPAIREGDMPQIVNAIVAAMTLNNKAGQVIGIDEKAGVELLYEQLPIENYADLLEEQYPEKEYDPDRTTEPVAAPIQKPMPNPGGVPQNPGGKQVGAPTEPMTPPPVQNQKQEAARRLLRLLQT